MRYYQLLAEVAILALAASCSIAELEVAEIVPVQQREITITATSGELDTRTVREADGAVLWNPGDQISLFYGSGTEGGSCFTAQNTEPARVAQFTGTIGVITGGSEINFENTYFWAVYPYNAAASCDGNSITTVLPSSQVATADTFADDLFLTMGRSQGLSIAFYNICGGVKFTVSEEGIKRVTVKGNSGEQIAGTITVGFDENKLPKVTSIANGSDTIILNAPAGETFQVGKAYYFVIVPTVFENGFTLTFNKGDTWAVYERTQKATIRRSVFGTISAPDAGLQWNQMQYVSIPDENFRAYMIQNFDSNGDGELDELEAAAVRRIDDLYTDSISSLTGIESLVNLEWLRCPGSRSIGVKDNYENYTYYSGGTGQLTTLDLSHNPLLKYVNCSNNQISNIDLSNNTLLDKLYCGYNLLEELDLSANTALKYLNCNGNQNLKTIDLSNNMELREFSFMLNDIPSIDLSGHTKLEIATFSMSHLASLDISGCSSLQKLQYHEGRLESLRIGNNTALTYMNIWGNRLTSLDLSGCPALTSLYCDSNQLVSLDVSSNTELIYVRCDKNQLTSLDVSANAALNSLSCPSNQLTSLNLSNCPALAYVDCANNQLNSLDLSNHQALSKVYCDSNQLASLDLSNCSALTYVICKSNLLTSLDVSGDTNLSTLQCKDNQLTSLDVSSNPNLTSLQCDGNQLSRLDVSSNSALNTLGCTSNPTLEGIWLSLGQTIESLEYDSDVTCIKYVGVDYDSELPTEITNADEFIYWLLRANSSVTGEYRITVSEIDMAGKSFTSSIGFAGVLDGNGCVIKNLSSGTPLFNNLRGTVKNLVFDNSCCFSPTVPVFGAIADESYGLVSGIVNNAEVIYAEGSIDEANSTITFGSLVGSNYGTVENCSNTAAVTLHYSTLSKDKQSCIWGGLVGYTAGAVRNCLNSGSFAVKVATPASGAFHSIGGIVGMYDGISGQSVVTGCSNTGDVSLEHGTAAYFAVGGVVGSSPSGKQTPGNYGVVDNCTNEGNVSIHYINGGSGAYPNVGGVVGYTEGQLTSCINRGNISILCDSESLTWTGIRIAGVGGTVTRGASQCHNYGRITVDALCAGGTYGNRGLGNIASCCFAGVVALAGPYTADSSVLFEKCYNHVDLDLAIKTLTETSNHYCGGVFGYVTGTIADSENDGNITITCPTSINRLGGIAAGCCFGVSGCTNRGALVLNHPAITKTDWRSFIGGIVADASKAGATTCSNCANSGNLSFYSTATPSSSKVSALGGIVGCGAADSQIEFSNCSNNGSFEFNSSGLVVTGDLRGGDYN